MNGTDVLVLIEGEVVGSQTGVTFDEKTDVIDVSSKESRARRIEAGRYSATVKLDSLYVPDDTAYQSLKTAVRNGTKVTVLRQEDGAALEHAEAVVTSVSEAAPDQDKATVAVGLEIDGEWVAGS